MVSIGPIDTDVDALMAQQRAYFFEVTMDYRGDGRAHQPVRPRDRALEGGVRVRRAGRDPVRRSLERV